MNHRFLPSSRLGRRELWLLPEAFCALLRARLEVSLTASAAYLPGTHRQTGRLSVEKTETAARIAFVIEGLALRTPWHSTCLVRSLAARRMLLRRGIPCTLHLGVHKEGPRRDLGAHAWLTVGEQILIGGGRMERYAEIARFG